MLRRSITMQQSTVVLLTAIAWLMPAPADAQRIRRRAAISGQHELSGGIGFAADLSTYAPGGFKWFNDYGHHLSGPTWLNLQFNVTAGSHGRRGCGWSGRGFWACDDWYGFGGTALELAGGVKLKWPVSRVPLQINAKLGGAVNMIWFGDFYGAAVGFRGGAGVRYFFVPTFSAGTEMTTTLGPAFLRHGLGTNLYAALDLNFGVEWRF